MAANVLQLTEGGNFYNKIKYEDMNFNIPQMFLRSRIYRFWLGAVSGRFSPIRYYITEFFCWVVCGIEFYKDYRRFYKGQDKGQSVP